MIQKLTVFISFQRRYNRLKTKLDGFLNILNILFKNRHNKNNHFQNFARDQRGATAIEYGLIAALISVVILAALGSTGLNLGGLYTDSLGEVEDNIGEANSELE